MGNSHALLHYLIGFGGFILGVIATLIVTDIVERERRKKSDSNTT